jgi:hypothetical protein
MLGDVRAKLLSLIPEVDVAEGCSIWFDLIRFPRSRLTLLPKYHHGDHLRPSDAGDEGFYGPAIFKEIDDHAHD